MIEKITRWNVDPTQDLADKLNEIIEWINQQGEQGIILRDPCQYCGKKLESGVIHSHIIPGNPRK